MSQAGKLTRARQLAGSVWPGRAVDGYSNLIVARLRKLTAAKSTGVLPFSGHGEGGIFFRDGQVVYAQSTRTPGWRTSGLMALGLAPETAETARPGVLGRLVAVLTATEATVDAASELMASQSRYARFRADELPTAIDVCDVPLEGLLDEVDRRHKLLRQISATVTPDTVVVRTPDMPVPVVQVSAWQWALLLRVRGGATPRELAMEVSKSVFRTTLEVHRLLELGLLRVPGNAGGSEPLSFIRAVTEER
jgi:hypothetical protein